MTTTNQTTDTYYALNGATGEMREDFTSPDAAARWLAESLGVPRSDLHLADRSSSGGSEVRYEVTRRDGVEVGSVGSNDDAEPAAGYEDRAVQRARDEGII